MVRRIVFTATIISLLISVVITQSIVHDERSSAIQLREFQSYSNVHISEYYVPENAWGATFTFNLLVMDQSCYGKNPPPQVFLQYGGIPLINPHNITYPQQFNMKRDVYPTYQVFNSDSTNIYGISNPKSGYWFLAAYLPPDNQSQTIRPKGLFGDKNCEYFLDTNFKVFRNEAAIVPVLNTQEEKTITITPFEPQKYRVYVTELTELLNLTMLSCDSTTNQSDHFHIKLQGSSRNCTCDNITDCSMSVHTPVNDYVDLRIYLDHTPDYTRGEITLKLVIHPHEAPVIELHTYNNPEIGYKTRFITDTFNTWIIGNKSAVLMFKLLPLIHNGGTLKYMITVNHTGLAAIDKYQDWRLRSCLSLDKIYHDNTLSDCSNEFVINKYDQSYTQYQYIPFPTAGNWYITLVAECYNTTTLETVHSRICDTLFIPVIVNISTEPCIDNSCQHKGECQKLFSRVIHWSTCKCRAGFRGLDCSDSAEALSTSQQLLETLLLTLSNILFLIAALNALYRKWFIQSLVYAFVFYSSTVYHTCDNGTEFFVCIYNYSMLQTCDFYGAVLAVWLTILAMAKIPDELRHFLEMFGSLGILMGTLADVSSLYTFTIPLSISMVILIASWILICRREKSCYPALKCWLSQLLPGFICAATGICLYAFVETTDNYYYVHSIWHLLMASAVCFLLPQNKSLNIRQICRTTKRKLTHCNHSETTPLNSDSDGSELSDCNLIVPSTSQFTTDRPRSISPPCEVKGSV